MTSASKYEMGCMGKGRPRGGGDLGTAPAAQR
jgi:hypothetical protein